MSEPCEPLDAVAGPAIRIFGAREHNLDNVSVAIPRDRFTVITGVSGSGKSSLAFDTLYAEGQRRYVESLSTHARQFLEQLHKPDVDRIEGLTPTVAIEQRLTTGGPRSTVATVTEIHDFLRVLFARTGVVHCWQCGRAITRQSPSTIVDEMVEACEDEKALILAPAVAQCRGGHAALLASILRQGFVRARVDGRVELIEELAPLPPAQAHTIEIVVDRVRVRDAIANRLFDAVETAARLGGGRLIVARQTGEGAFQDAFFSTHYACPLHPEVTVEELSPAMFSFNSPHGACTACDGLGGTMEFDPDLIIPDWDLSLSDGAVAAWKRAGRSLTAAYGQMIRQFCECFSVLPDAPLRKVPRDKVEILLNGTSPEDAAKYGAAFEGVLPNLRRRWESTDSETVKQRLHAYRGQSPCQACGGARLKPASLAVRVGGLNLAEVCRMNLAAALKFFRELDFTGEAAVPGAPLLAEIRQRLQFLSDVGVEYLTLDRAADTLSGGEAQRLRLATQIGSQLVGVCFVLDEPTIGLHQRDTQRLIATLRSLTARGNTVVVVEHDEEMIRAAEHVIDVGPGAGIHGGQVVAVGTLDDIVRCERSTTGMYLSGMAGVPVPLLRRRIDWRRSVTVLGARENNLRGIDVRFPLGCTVCVTGVSGSGKSTLVNHILLRALQRKVEGGGPRPGAHDRLQGAALVDKIIPIDQSPIGRSPRSNPATYVGVLDPIRKLFARTREARLRGYAASRFSFNVKGGRCEPCQGQGTKRIEMHFLPDVFVTCDACQGRRFHRETLEIRYRGKNIADVLDMRVDEAMAFFDNVTDIRWLLRSLKLVGLGYVSLGQSAATLSGGEAQRVKLAAQLGRAPRGQTVYVLDEPTRGLHAADVHTLLRVLGSLVDRGHTVITIEHHLDVIKCADWVIDLGPGGGEQGGAVVAAGTPEEVAQCPASETGRFLRQRLQTVGA
ncbi:MAG: excinuclease ABC subunit UvrA [Phycisphaerales bacterium]|nr:MAG: excinuclease ABC subunit UvrA [Phycisphaerales bacterium]